MSDPLEPDQPPLPPEPLPEPTQADPAPKRRRVPVWQRLLVGGNLKVTFVRGCITALICIGIFKYIYLPMWIEGVSMEPTYTTSQFNFVNALAYRSAKPQRGEIVAIRTRNSKAMLMKRVIGLPGERLSIRSNIVYIDGEPLDEPYVKYRAARPWRYPGGGREPEILASDEYFVVGDNRGMPMTNHVFGVIALSNIVGRIVF